MASFFQGSVTEAVADSRAGFKPLLVLLTDGGVEGAAAERALLSADSELLASSVLLRLEDDLANTDPARFAAAKQFRAFCPTDALPTVALVSPLGATLVLLKGPQLADSRELHAALHAAHAQLKQQQQAFLAAQAFATLAQRAQQQAPQQQQQQPPESAAAMEATSAPEQTQAEGANHAEPAAPPSAASASGSDYETEEAMDVEPAAAVAEFQAERDQQAQQQQQGQGEEEMEMEQEPAGGAEAAAGGGDSSAAGQPGAAPASPAQAAAPPAVAAVAASEEPPPPPAVHSYLFRFMDGTTLRAEFSPQTPLAEVFGAIDEARAARGGTVAPVPYVLVLPHPRRQYGPEDEGRTLGQLGLAQPRISLAVVPNPKGHVPPAPPAAPAPAAPQPGASTGEAEAPGVAAAAAPQRPPGPGGLVRLQIRLSNGDVLRAEFEGSSTTLGQVLDYIDANRTDGSKPYQVSTGQPKRTFYMGDLDETLCALGLGPRASLQCDLLPPRPKAKPAVVPEAPALPSVFALQFRQPDGGTLRGEFPPEATLQQVCHYIDTHRTDGGGVYTLVQPYPRRKYGLLEEELGQSLLALGLNPRSLLLMEPRAEAAGGGAGTGGWSLGGLLSSAASYLNPMAYLRGSPLVVGEAAEEQAQGSGVAGVGEEAAAAEEPGASRPGARKRSLGQAHGGDGPNIHTLGREDGGKGQRRPEQNEYWNGNSTAFGGDDDGRGD